MSSENVRLELRLLWLLLGYALLAFIITVSIVPSPVQVDTGLDWQDKLFHTLAYFCLMFWFMQIYHATRQKLVFGLFFVVVGVGLEIIQAYTPERYFEVADMLANTAGVVLAYLLSKTGLRLCLYRFEQLFFKG